jgi:hypothetical protein
MEETAIELFKTQAYEALPPARQTLRNVDFIRNLDPIQTIELVRTDKDLSRDQRLQETAARIELHFHGEVHLTINNYYTTGGNGYQNPSGYDGYSCGNSTHYLPPHYPEYTPPEVNVNVSPNIYVEGSKSRADSTSRQDNSASGGVLVLGAIILAICIALLSSGSD